MSSKTIINEFNNVKVITRHMLSKYMYCNGIIYT